MKQSTPKKTALSTDSPAIPIYKHRFALSFLLVLCLIIILIWTIPELLSIVLTVLLTTYTKLITLKENFLTENIHFNQTTINLDNARIVHTTRPEFLSFAIDTSVWLGGSWWSPSGKKEKGGLGSHKVSPLDLENPKLIKLAKALSPSYLRLGGSEADKVLFQDSDSPVASKSTKPSIHLYPQNIDQVISFAQNINSKILFTANAGPLVRDFNLAWQSDNLEKLINYLKSKNYSFPVWELGNEVNAFWVIHGPSSQIEPAQYLKDLARFNELIKSNFPESQTAGPAAAFWPVIGETPSREGSFMRAILHPQNNLNPDIITWHYYPQQSRRCPLKIREAQPGYLFNPFKLSDVSKWAVEINQENPRDLEVWLGETGNAQCGGEPGVSDTFESTIWWLDLLGQMARNKQKLVIRQSLVGSNYGLLAEDSFEPRPDYFASLLWKKTMGKEVLAPSSLSNSNPFLRLYLHCSAESKEHLTILAINISQKLPAQLIFAKNNPLAIYQLQADGSSQNSLLLNGQKLALLAQGEIPALTPQNSETNTVNLPPVSATFVNIPAGLNNPCD